MGFPHKKRVCFPNPSNLMQQHWDKCSYLVWCGWMSICLQGLGNCEQIWGHLVVTLVCSAKTTCRLWEVLATIDWGFSITSRIVLPHGCCIDLTINCHTFGKPLASTTHLQQEWPEVTIFSFCSCGSALPSSPTQAWRMGGGEDWGDQPGTERWWGWRYETRVPSSFK